MSSNDGNEDFYKHSKNGESRTGGNITHIHICPKRPVESKEDRRVALTPQLSFEFEGSSSQDVDDDKHSESEGDTEDFRIAQDKQSMYDYVSSSDNGSFIVDDYFDGLQGLSSTQKRPPLVRPDTPVSCSIDSDLFSRQLSLESITDDYSNFSVPPSVPAISFPPSSLHTDSANRSQAYVLPPKKPRVAQRSKSTVFIVRPSYSGGGEMRNSPKNPKAFSTMAAEHHSNLSTSNRSSFADRFGNSRSRVNSDSTTSFASDSFLTRFSSLDSNSPCGQGKRRNSTYIPVIQPLFIEGGKHAFLEMDYQHLVLPRLRTF
eukprot:CAMPEP_0175151818 /NCGR_PEP_ID=MMETSP0087-20121206/18741_1 /TAXON_ID=136419 /ORGANISM="Unknown Unknown, Strain D1" /LENGTH=316 /DNA_ID=CAMNT_0016438125 /DNA_START=32 /DNA_END=979 /DNA_ORIENTATION=+